MKTVCRLQLGLMALVQFGEPAVARAGIIYVSSLSNREVLRFDADSGIYIDTFVAASSGVLSQPHGMLERCRDVLVADREFFRIARFNRVTGDLVEIIPFNFDRPVYLRYGPDERIYISDQGRDEILRCELLDEGVCEPFVSSSGFLDGPSGFAFAPDNRLYVAGRYSANVVAYDAATGALDEVVADSSDGLGVGTTFGVALGDNGDLYFASNNTVFRFDLATQTIVATIPVNFPIGLEAGPDGGVYVATDNNLRRIDTADNSISGPLLTGGTIKTLNFFHFSTTPPVPVCSLAIPTLSAWGLCILGALVATAGTVLALRRAASLRPCGRCAVDADPSADTDLAS